MNGDIAEITPYRGINIYVNWSGTKMFFPIEDENAKLTPSRIPLSPKDIRNNSFVNPDEFFTVIENPKRKLFRSKDKLVLFNQIDEYIDKRMGSIREKSRCIKLQQIKEGKMQVVELGRYINEVEGKLNSIDLDSATLSYEILFESDLGLINTSTLFDYSLARYNPSLDKQLEALLLSEAKGHYLAEFAKTSLILNPDELNGFIVQN